MTLKFKIKDEVWERKFWMAQGYKPNSRTVAERRRWRLGDSFATVAYLTLKQAGFNLNSPIPEAYGMPFPVLSPSQFGGLLNSNLNSHLVKSKYILKW